MSILFWKKFGFRIFYNGMASFQKRKSLRNCTAMHDERKGPVKITLSPGNFPDMDQKGGFFKIKDRFIVCEMTLIVDIEQMPSIHTSSPLLICYIPSPKHFNHRNQKKRRLTVRQQRNVKLFLTALRLFL